MLNPFESIHLGDFLPAGLIEKKFNDLGGQAILGAPLAGVAPTPDNVGAFQHYQNGWSIYWSPATDAHEVHGAIRAKWEEFGWERGLLGYPETDETSTPDGVGRFNHFQGGSIYWTPVTGAHEVHGAIRDKWAALGWETSHLGFPLTDETPAPDEMGRFNAFQNGTIYWSPATGAVEIPVVQTWDVGSITFSDSTALGGNCRLVMNNSGEWTFSGHMHDSGFDTYEFGVTAVALTPSGIAYTLEHTGRTEGTSAGLPFGTPNRDHDWTITGMNSLVRDNWMQAALATFKVSVVSQDKLAQGINQALQDALAQLAQAGAKLVVALLTA
jgi:hypothetical protein